MLVAQPVAIWGPASRTTVWSGPLVKLGGSLTGATLMLNVCAALVLLSGAVPEPLSRAAMVTVAVPLAFAAVWNVSVPVVPSIVCKVVKTLTFMLFPYTTLFRSVTTKETVWAASSGAGAAGAAG